MDFKTIDSRYRPVPFWSWNEHLTVGETRRQVDSMKSVGIGGCFMHARGGLQTPYMGEEWFENVAACIEECEKQGMHPWAYDENGWPSGFGNGAVNGLGEDYWQKYLRHRPAEADRSDIPANRIIGEAGGHLFYYEVNPFYVDTLSEKVVAKFLEAIYHPYYEKFGTRFDGFFTDEPQISRDGIPWSLTLPEEYRAAYGEDLLPILPALFYPTEGYAEARIRFWSLVTELFSAHFMKQIHDDCAANGVRFTGHLVLEESLASQITSNGACMPHYEYFDIPGMDWLCRPIFPCLTLHQLAGAAAQAGRPQILSETFALCGHNVGQDEMKRNYEWMMVRGVNLLCQHLEGYSLRGIRKRDYPPAMYEQQPWWQDSKYFNDAMSRIGMLLAKGEINVDTLLLHNMVSGWTCFDNGENRGLEEYNQAMLADIATLEHRHVAFHLGDEILLRRHGRVEGKKLVVGKMAYSRVILPKHCAMLPTTKALLDAFRAAGGEILESAEQAKDNPVVDSPDILCTSRRFDGLTLWYFVNSHNREIPAHISAGSYTVDPLTGEERPFDPDYVFPPYGSLLVVDDGTPCRKPEKTPVLPALPLDGEWEVVGNPENALTLDKCDYWFDGELQDTDAYVLNVANRALALERPVTVRCRFTVYADTVPDKLTLCMETPERFALTVNGKAVTTDREEGFFRDRSFRRIDISGTFRAGENRIETEMRFIQSPEIYENLRRARIFESEKNKLTFDSEIEAMYLVGDFGVRCDGEWQDGDNTAADFTGRFVLTDPVHRVTLTHIEKQGFPFFAGSLTLRRTFPAKNCALRFAKRGVNALHASVNGREMGVRLWAPYEIDLSAGMTQPENTVDLTLVGNLRNLLGPHHHVGGEIYSVGPFSFFDEPCIWNGFCAGSYTPRYCFTEVSLFNSQKEEK